MEARWVGFLEPRWPEGWSVRVVRGFDLGRGAVAEVAVQPVVVEPADPSVGRDLEVVGAALPPPVGDEGRGVAVQFGLEQPDRVLRHRGWDDFRPHRKVATGDTE